MKEIIILGAGKGFFETHELIKAINKEKLRYEIIGILDDDNNKHGEYLEGVKVLGGLALVEKFRENKDIYFVFAIGSVYTRNIRGEIMKKLNIYPERFVTLIHPRAEIASTAKIGYGCIIHAGTTILPYAEISNFVVMVFNSYIGLFSKIGEYSLITSHVVILNYVVIEKMSFIGVNASIKDELKIAENSVVGIGSVVTHDTKIGELVMGNPARSVGIAEKFLKA